MVRCSLDIRCFDEKTNRNEQTNGTNEQIGMFSAAASLGVSLLWDTDVGLSQIDKYAYADDDFIKVSSL